jgi:polysaccharide biosynthesis protein PslH
LLKNKSYNIQRFKCSELNKQLSSYLNQNQIDLVILESVYLSGVYQVIRDNSKAKIIIRTHNVEFNLWERLASNQGNGFKKFYLNKLAKTLQKEELELLNKVDGVMCITDSDKKLLLSNGINKPLITVPVSIETVDSEPNYEIAQFYHLGTMNWEPNIEAVHHLIYEIFPKIKAKRPYAKLCIAGSNMTNKMKNLKIDGVEFIGFVPSIPQFLNQAGILLSPIQSGSGVRVKLLESMGSGIPIVTTELGKEGINIENGKELFFTDNDETFIEYAIELFDSESLRRKIGIQAKQHIRKEYLIENIKKQAFEFIQNIS